LELSKKISEEEVLLALSKQMDVPVEELKKELEETLIEVKKDERLTNAKDSEAREIARNRLVTSKRRELASPANTWKGIILGIGDLVDTVRKVRRLSEEAYALDPIKTSKGWVYKETFVLAKTEDVVDPDSKETSVKIIPLYPKTEANDKYKRSLTPIPEHSWLRNVYGVALPIDKKTRKQGEVRVFSMTLNRKLAIEGKKIPLMNPVDFKGIDKTTAEDTKAGEYKINASTYTEFKLDPALQLPPLEDIIVTNCAKKFVLLGELDQWHKDHEKDNTRWCITQGIVSNLNLEPNEKTKNMRMTLDDESLMFATEKEGRSVGVQFWIPTDRNLDMEFGQDSRIYVVGKTGRGKAYDRETRQQLDEPGDVNFNVYGIYIPDIFRISKEVEPVPESSLSPTDEPLGEDVGTEEEENEEKKW
jgi:hypothetical protein